MENISIILDPLFPLNVHQIFFKKFGEKLVIMFFIQSSSQKKRIFEYKKWEYLINENVCYMRA